MPRLYEGYAEGEPVPLVDENPQPSAIIATGLASWYSADRYNKRTFSGVPFDEAAMTAAHPWLPMGTRLRVTLVGTDTSVVVTINDRQGSKTRVIDLSKRAARELGILERGIARVVLSRL
jgi:rare lipoprotein A